LKDKVKKPLFSLVAIFIAVVAADQCTKQLAQAKLLDAEFHEHTDNYQACDSNDPTRDRFVARQRRSVSVIDGFFDLRYVENCASAFGLMSGVPESWRFAFFFFF
jgi:lipoprotein signal peptidase